MGYEWAVADTNFDNVFQALISIFILSTQENWPYIMYTAMDSDNEIYVTNYFFFFFLTRKQILSRVHHLIITNMLEFTLLLH